MLKEEKRQDGGVGGDGVGRRCRRREVVVRGLDLGIGGLDRGRRSFWLWLAVVGVVDERVRWLH